MICRTVHAWLRKRKSRRLRSCKSRATKKETSAELIDLPDTWGILAQKGVPSCFGCFHAVLIRSLSNQTGWNSSNLCPVELDGAKEMKGMWLQQFLVQLKVKFSLCSASKLYFFWQWTEFSTAPPSFVASSVSFFSWFRICASVSGEFPIPRRALSYLQLSIGKDIWKQLSRWKTKSKSDDRVHHSSFCQKYHAYLARCKRSPCFFRLKHRCRNGFCIAKTKALNGSTVKPGELQMLQVVGCTGRFAQRFAFDALMCIFGNLHFDRQVLLQDLVNVDFHQNILSVLRVGLVSREAQLWCMVK